MRIILADPAFNSPCKPPSIHLNTIQSLLRMNPQRSYILNRLIHLSNRILCHDYVIPETLAVVIPIHDIDGAIMTEMSVGLGAGSSAGMSMSGDGTANMATRSGREVSRRVLGGSLCKKSIFRKEKYSIELKSVRCFYIQIY